MCFLNRFLLVGVLIFLESLSNLYGATYFMAPNGNDSAAGTTTAAWKTFPKAVSTLKPGDTLILKDGQYTVSANGRANIDCARHAEHGTPSAPITIQAENERQAFIQGDGMESAFKLRNCQWWIIHGLHIENRDNADNRNAHPAHIVLLESSSQIIFTRNLAAKPNRYGNNQGILAYAPRKAPASTILIEENELYEFHRNGIQCFPESMSHCTVRRNYINDRGYGTLTGVDRFGPNDGLVMYFGRDSIVENNIVEMGTTQGGIVNFGDNNQFLGNITLNAVNGFINAKHLSYGPYNVTSLFVNNVAVGGGHGMFSRSAKEPVFINNMVLEAEHGVVFDNFPDRRNNSFCEDGTERSKRHKQRGCWTVSPDVTVMNTLAVNNSSTGFRFRHADQFSKISLSYLNAQGNRTNYLPGTIPRTRSGEINPRLGSCKVFIPEDSPMKGKGRNGDDIGANVLCRYENGMLTEKRLWDWSTGAFPCGALVPGVNDIPGRSCYDVHTRLNVNTNGCLLPKNPVCKQPTLPNAPNNPNVPNLTCAPPNKE
jgi:hypothetical protein